MTRRERVTAAFARSSPWQKVISIVGGLTTIAVFVGILAGCARWINQAASEIPTKTEIAKTYVAKDTFNALKQDLVLQHRTDSLISDARAARTDSSLSLLVRACRKRGECL